jgi:hypothetical protein
VELFRLARGHVFENFVEAPNGTWVSKKDLEEDSVADFESLLKEMKKTDSSK